MTLVVPARFRDRLWLTYAWRSFFTDPGARTFATRLEPCPPGTRGFRGGTVGPVTGFSGGFVVTRPVCYALEVRVDGRAAPYRGRLRLGAPCR